METKTLCILVLFFVNYVCCHQFEPWTYECDEFQRCIKKSLYNSYQESEGISHAECLLTCNAENDILFPKPKEVTLSKTVVPFEIDDVEFSNKGNLRAQETTKWLERNLEEQIEWVKKKKVFESTAKEVGNLFSINIFLEEDKKETHEPKIKKSTKEDYTLKVKYNPSKNIINATISSNCYFGARHALETLFQLIEHDPIRKAYIIPDNVDIKDHPEFVHRGVTLDTARNFHSVEVIKRIIDGLAHSKMNVFHWHITDTNAIPIEMMRDPLWKMTKYGSYGPDKTYTQKDVKEIVSHAHYRGVRIIPEFDQPAHVANGWDFPGAEDLTVCANEQPWYDLCYEPPCGQLNPTKPMIYDILEKIYAEWYELFDYDTFHMGADEVKFGCWNKSDSIVEYMTEHNMPRTEEGFVQLWSEFQEKSSSRLKKVFSVYNSDKDDVDIMVWTSGLTKGEHLDNLPNDDYIVQIWTNASDTSDNTIKALSDGNYRMVFSNYDTLYLDCGYGAWVGKGNNWCSPYKGWQKIYENDPYAILEKHSVELTKEKKDLVLGGEVCMWSEQVDSETVEGKIFPRASAMGERLWSNPQSDFYSAESRMVNHRNRLIHRGVRADALQPEWCRQNNGQCYVDQYNPHKN